MSSTLRASLEQVNVGQMLLRVRDWIRNYEGNPNAKNYRAICMLMAVRSLPAEKLASLVRQVNASKNNAPHWLASLFFRGRSQATQRAYTELEGILGIAGSPSEVEMKPKYQDPDDFGTKVELPSSMRRLRHENQTAPW